MRYFFKKQENLTLKILPEFEVNINTLSHDGRGIAIIQGKTAFIQGALAGETIKCKITRQHRRYYEGIVLDVITPSPERVNPHCTHFNICGGCSLQHMDTMTQINWKQKVLLEQLQHFGKVIPEEVLAPISGKTYGYRGKARLGARFVIKKDKLLVGFREKFSNYLADISSCAVLHPTIGEKLVDLQVLIRSLSSYQHIPQIEVARGDDITALIFRHLEPLHENDLQKLRDFGQKHHFAIYLQPNPPEKIHKLWPLDDSLNLSYTLPEFAIELAFEPTTFTQVNSEINRSMVSLAISLLNIKPTDIILDLFCGMGNFSLPIAKFAKKVIGVEGNEVLVKKARENAVLNNIENTEFFTANLMSDTLAEPFLQQKYDKILIDPPRTGAKEILMYLPTLQAKTIVYVSCNPATLARDAGELVHNQGYQLKKVGIINMFPHTSHVEAISLFQK